MSELAAVLVFAKRVEKEHGRRVMYIRGGRPVTIADAVRRLRRWARSRYP